MIRENMMKKSILRASAALQAVALLGAGSAAFIAAPAAAQDYTSGSLSGNVTTATGAPVGGAAVTVRSVQQGSVRTVTTDSNGGFTISNLPAGDYDVTVNASGQRTFTATAVNVVPGQTSSIPIMLSAGTAEAGGGGAIVVSGRRIQAFTGTTTGLNVDVEQVQKTVPVGRNLTSVVLLAPSTSRGDTAFGNLASIGGGSVAENAYYVNGLNITNFDNYLGSATVPFDFYKSVEVKAGGYPAEFGRATGGIVNAITKAGTNEWMGAVHVNWAPEFLRSDGRNLQTCQDVDRTDTDPVTPGIQNDPLTQKIVCTNSTNTHADYNRSLTTTLEAGGPIFRDRLFVYGLLQLNSNHYQTISRVEDPLTGIVTASSTAFRYENNSPFWGAKIDAIPIDGQHLEFTIFDTRNITRRTDIPYGEVDGQPTFGVGSAVTDFRGGGVNFVGKYTGRLTDWLTVSGAYGRMRDRFDFSGVAGAAGLPYIRNLSNTTVGGVPNNGFFNGQRLQLLQNPYDTQRKFYRGDIDILANFVGSHHFRAGFDVEKNTLNEATVTSGKDFLCGGGYLTNDACTFGAGGAGARYLLRPPIVSGGPVVIEVNYYNTGGSFEAKNDAIYLEDEWKPTDRLTINAGIRRDNFRVNSSTGDVLAKLSNNWAPRIGMTYDLWSDKRGRLKAFYGQYYLPFASNTAFRMTGTEYYFNELFVFGGIDSRGGPILGAPVQDATHVGQCPFLLTPTSVADHCFVTSRGFVPDSSQALSHNLKATKESEAILGYEHRLGRWKLGVNFIHRSLLQTAEDAAVDAAAIAYCESQGIDCSSYYTGFAQYVVINPGSDVVVNLAGVPGNPEVTLKAEDLGYPRAKRTYDAVEFTFDRPYDGVWSLGGSYTWSKSKGNSEGFVQSDFGQDDAGITQDFDQPGFIEGSYGYLPNDRRHRFKAYGAYTLWDAFTIGANYTLESPRSLSCFGYHPTDVFARGYRAASHYCGGVLSPRGTASKTGWVSTLDMKFAYKLRMPFGETTLHADVFNVFNSQAIQKRNEFGDAGVVYVPGTHNTVIKGYVPNPNYDIPTLYQAPRSVRLGLDIAFGGVTPPPPVVAPPVEIPPPPPATVTCESGAVVTAPGVCPPVAPPPPPPPAPVERGERGQ